ncbi:oligosaccharide flippase family protein [Altererythrobacter salegens]|uniref:Oligosaccharide flippase family protein n=1 Tax=Croceibacterium salegens TaxID=1737568 RepID=A0A6I4SZX3_9SPHN|nr:lipopolysaccharide biosynthesis protein [Croceibacterium salegens]MXO59882.1 oligosaccharide flippase family protein [Croceibacterium salegens]
MPAPSQPRSLLGRMLANTAWLLGGKGFGGLCSLVYLAILARSLGLKDFGHFSLIFGSAQALIAFSGLQTWRVVVRYGAEHVHTGNWAAFGRLSMLSALLDLAGALIGVIIAFVIYFEFNEALGLNPKYLHAAFWFTVASLFALVSTPTGIVRALDRFDLGVYVEALVPSLRLVAAVAIWLTDPKVVWFLAAWAAIDLIEAGGYWILARRLCPEAVNLRHLHDWRQAGEDNPGIVRFSLVAFASATLDAAVKQGPLLAVGYLVGTRAAGLYRLANQLSQGLGKLSVLLTRAAYAEINRARVAAEHAEFRRLVRQTSLIAAAAGAVVVILAVLFGKPLLDLIGGSDFEAGYAVLVPLTFAASLELASVAFEPVLHSTGHARYALYGRLAGFIVLAGVILWVWDSATAVTVGLAVAVGGIATYIALGALAWYVMSRLTPHPPTAGEAP